MKVSGWDRFLLSVAPKWAANRLRARAAADMLSRHYEAASLGRRTSGWNRSRGDGNSVNAAALVELRTHARDLIRNNGWAKRAQRVIANNTVGWGLVPKSNSPDQRLVLASKAAWKAWAESVACDAEGLRNFAGLQHLAMRHIVSDGEVLIRRRERRPEDELPIPLQLQVLEADYLDTSKDGLTGIEGGPITCGVEYDAIGRRTAYWLFDQHPGGSQVRNTTSKRVSARNVLHVFYPDRASSARGVSWLSASIVNIKDLDEFEDAEIMKQKIAACFAGFVTDPQGAGAAVGEEDTSDERVEQFQPGTVSYLKPGETIEFATPPAVVADNFAQRTLRKIAAGLGVTYEDLTGDYSQVNFSSARMARLAHWGNVYDWRENMLVPMLCQGVWTWAMEAAFNAGLVSAVSGSEWAGPPMPMIEPDKEGLAAQRLVRAGIQTFSGMLREQGIDPESHWLEYAADLKRLDDLEIKLDSDVRAVSQAGQLQAAQDPAAPDSAPPDPVKSQSLEKIESKLDQVQADLRARQEVEIPVDVSAFEGKP